MKQRNNKINKNVIASSTLTNQLIALREELDAGELNWSKTAVSNLAYAIDQTRINPDIDMLSLVVDAALRGESIEATYPKFYQRLSQNKLLADIFADMMAAMKDPLPRSSLPFVNLSFLERAISKPPDIITSLSRQWEAVWQLVSDELDQIFMPSALVYRSAGLLLDVDSTILLYNEFEAGGETWQATLEALAQPDAPGQVELFLSVSTEQEPSPRLQATVWWGDYQQTAVLDSFGRVHFPPFGVERILDEEKTAVSQNLHLQLHPIE